MVRSPAARWRGVRELGWMLYDMDFSDPQAITPCFFKAALVDGVLDVSDVQCVR